MGPSPTTLKKLFALSGNRCAFPGCLNRLFDEKGRLVGDVCHIAGAKLGSKRYDSTQTDAERHSFDNLICLCANHHRVIDADEHQYTRSVLLTMKRQHEAQATAPFVVPEDRLTQIAKALGWVTLGATLGEIAREMIDVARTIEKAVPETESISSESELDRFTLELVDDLRLAPTGRLQVICYERAATPLGDYLGTVFKAAGWLVRIEAASEQMARDQNIGGMFIFRLRDGHQLDNAQRAVEEVFAKCGFSKNEQGLRVRDRDGQRLSVFLVVIQDPREFYRPHLLLAELVRCFRKLTR